MTPLDSWMSSSSLVQFFTRIYSWVLARLIQLRLKGMFILVYKQLLFVQSLIILPITYYGY